MGIAPFPTPPSIAELLAELGAPRCRAEQHLLRQVRQFDSKHAAIDAELASEALPTWRQEQLQARAHLLWTEAHATFCAIQAFRDAGGKPVLELVERRATTH